jgi:DtxR family transcriptional regulator, manganese transport regulator
VELVEDLIEETGRARVTDLAERLNVRSATVTQMVRRLAEEDLVEWSPYQAIILTEKGTAMALRSRERHRVVLEFLGALGVPQEAAMHDSEGIEHHVSEETLAAMIRFLSKSQP